MNGGDVSIDPYRLLAELAEAELELAETGRPEEIGPLYEEAERIITDLPAQAPTAAAPWLRRAAAAQARTAALLDGRLAEAGGDLGRLRVRRDAARSYAATAHARVR